MISVLFNVLTVTVVSTLGLLLKKECRHALPPPP